MLELFADPIFRAPTIGSMLMCFASGLVGGLVFLQRRSLVGETLSHAAYPGVVLSVFIGALLFPASGPSLAIAVLAGAFLTALIGLYLVEILERKLNISSDAALCFILSVFFGFGVLLASRIQMTHAGAFRQVQRYLFGQAATMVDAHLYLYGGMAVAVAVIFTLLYRYLELLHFDRSYAQSVGMPTRRIQGICYTLLVLAIVMGMRSVGVVLMSAMLVAPPITARWWTSKFSHFLIVSGFVGMVAGFMGNFLSLKLGSEQLALPTGPMIVLSAAVLSVLSLLLAPKRGVLPRLMTVARFKLRCTQENCLKALYKGKLLQRRPLISFLMRRKGWISDGLLTAKGYEEAANLIRLHRLWEVYLVHMGQSRERVHHSAEEMEHILTPELEQQLSELLDHPTEDPHAQPIPEGRRS